MTLSAASFKSNRTRRARDYPLYPSVFSTIPADPVPDRRILFVGKYGFRHLPQALKDRFRGSSFRPFKARLEHILYPELQFEEVGS